ncbi:hypothetical protein Tco_0330873 [Tanacetum coccineum]
MSSESTSSGTPRCLLIPSSKVKFQHHESNIAYNNAVALLEHHEPLFNPCLVFFQTVAFVLPSLRNPQQCASNISRTFGTPQNKSVVPLPPKGTVRVGLATLGLADKDKPSLTFTELNGKKNRETNVCYTRYISLVLEQLLGENYNDESLTVLKPHHILAASFQTLSASEVSLTSQMLKVAKLLKELDESLILPSEEVNAEATADKSKSRTNVQSLSQPKAPTAKKSKKKKILSSTELKVSNDSRKMNPPSTTTHLQATEELVVTVVSIQSLEVFVTAEVQENQLKATDTTKVPEKIVEKEEVAKEQTMEIPTVAHILDEVNKAAQETPASPYDTES